jgi:hypothetical protein
MPAGIELAGIELAGIELADSVRWWRRVPAWAAAIPVNLDCGPPLLRVAAMNPWARRPHLEAVF